MDGLLNLLPLYNEEAGRELNLGQFLQACRTHLSFSEHDTNESERLSAISVINSKLNTSDTRLEGALLLDALIPQCGTDTFTSNCISWIQQVMRLLQGPSKMDGGTTACLVMGKLLAFSAQFPELSRQVSTTVISPLVVSLCDPELKQNAQISEHALECLKSCMKYYSSPCGPLKATIERHLFSLVDWEDSSIQSVWALCMALLPGLGGSGTQGSQHKANWVESCSQILGAIHNSVDSLFRNVAEMKDGDTIRSALKLPELQHQNPMVLLHAERKRFMNLCSVVTTLLKEPFRVTKNVPIDQILELVSRLLAVNSKSITKSAKANFELLTLGSIIPDLHTAALDILSSLTVVCRGQLVTRAMTVMNLFVQVLQWTFTPFDKRQSATERPYGKLRSQVYQSLCLWLAASRSSCGLTKCVDILFTQLLSDIAVHRDTVELLTVSQPTVGGKKKKRLEAPNVILHKVDSKANADACDAALQCLSSLLLYCGPRIRPAVHKEVQEMVLSVLIDIANGAEFNSLLPYNDPRCRKGLYRVLEKLILCPSAQWPAPLNYATAAFNNGLNDPNLDVAMACTEGLVAIQAILRPRGPTLNFVMEAKQLRTVQQETPLWNGSFMRMELPPAVPAPQLAIRQPETSPTAAKTVETKSNGSLTPPGGLVTLPSASPPESGRMMTRKEALKVIASADRPALVVESAKQTPTEPSPVRKRLHDAVKSTAPPPEKILKELPYGTDEIDDDLDSMLASFRDVPVE